MQNGMGPANKTNSYRVQFSADSQPHGIMQSQNQRLNVAAWDITKPTDSLDGAITTRPARQPFAQIMWLAIAIYSTNPRVQEFARRLVDAVRRADGDTPRPTASTQSHARRARGYFRLEGRLVRLSWSRPPRRIPPSAAAYGDMCSAEAVGWTGSHTPQPAGLAANPAPLAT